MKILLLDLCLIFLLYATPLFSQENKLDSASLYKKRPVSIQNSNSNSNSNSNANSTQAQDDIQNYGFVLSGGYTKKYDHERYETISKNVYDIFTQNSVSTKVLGSDGQWTFPKPLDRFPANNKETVKKELIATLKGMKEKEKLNIFITDHGSKTGTDNGNKTLLNTGVILKSQEGKDPVFLSHQEIYEILRDHKKKGTYVQMVGIHCNAGGLNEIAAKLTGVCSSTSTNDENSTFSRPEINEYAEGFYKELKNKNDALARLHFAGMSNDYLNNGRQQLSSQAYIESLLPEFDSAEYSVDQIEKDFLYLLGCNQSYFNDSTLKALDRSLLIRQKKVGLKCQNESINVFSAKDTALVDISNIRNVIAKSETGSKDKSELKCLNLSLLKKQYEDKKWLWLFNNFDDNKLKAYAENVLQYSKELNKITEDYNRLTNNLTKETDESSLKYFKETSALYKNLRKKNELLIPYSRISEIRQKAILQKADSSLGLTSSEKEKILGLHGCEMKNYL